MEVVVDVPDVFAIIFVVSNKVGELHSAVCFDVLVVKVCIQDDNAERK